MSIPTDSVAPEESAQTTSPPDAELSNLATGEQSNRGASGGSSLGDGPAPTAHVRQPPGTATRDSVSSDQPENYGGGYGGQPRPKTS